ncbi:MAG: phosphomannomutase [Rickettsiales bacterium]|nr:phosphomannomutase [Rickettsiales bacterium]
MPNASALPQTGHRFHPSILRAYDVRGVIDDTLFAADLFALGQGFATEAAERSGHTQPRIVIARDGRLSSPALAEALSEGLQAGGAEVVDCGVGPTPMLYFAVYHCEADGGMMITGSHNPPSHNGCKMMMGRASFFGDDIAKLGTRIEAGDLRSAAGRYTKQDIQPAYVERLLEGLDRTALAEATIAWDPGHGAAAAVVAEVIAACNADKHVLLNGVIDGTFPGHHPDPSVPENMQELAEAVTAHQCTLGVAFDGDGDRLGAVDNAGNLISPDHLLMLLSRDVLSKAPDSTIIADVKTSQSVFDDIAQHGGTPLMWKTGHSHIKAKMKETGARFAGEASGHIFFADQYYGFDDGIYAALRLIQFAHQLDQPLDTLIAALPSSLSTPELRIECADDKKFGVVEAIAQRLSDEGADFSTIDGMRVNREGGWWLLRASNTQPALVARCEAEDPAVLQQLKDEITALLHPFSLRLS